MNASEIKPCPFCGSGDIGINQTNPNAIWFSCNTCGAETAPESHVDDALNNWNSRRVVSDE